MANINPQPAYFVGISLPSNLNGRFNALKKHIHDSDPHTLKPLVPHITLLHPPSLRSIPIDLLKNSIDVLSGQLLPFEITLKDVGFFEKEVCFMRAHSPQLDALQSALVELLPATIQTDYYHRPFTAHVTIAQKYRHPQLDIDAMTRVVNGTIPLPVTFTVHKIDIFIRTAERTYAVIDQTNDP